MVWIKYTREQIEELLKNKYVKSCTNKNVNFTLECKEKALELWNKGIFTKDIFKQLWFPSYIWNSKIPTVSLNRWRKNNEKWNIELKKWRPKKEKIDFNNMTLEQENEYLKAKLVYYEEIKKYLDSWLP